MEKDFPKEHWPKAFNGFRRRRVRRCQLQQLKRGRKRPEESVLAFITELEQIAARQVPEEHVIIAIVNGLGNSVATSCFLPCQTMEEVYRAIPKYDQIVAEATKRRPTATQPGEAKKVLLQLQ